MRTTLCWDCGSTYPMKQSHCPCGAPNANVDFDAAQAALEAAQADARPAPCARRYALAECRDIQANVMDRAQSWLNDADERGINITDENGYLAVIRDMMLEVVRLNERIAYLEPIFIAARNLTDNAEEWECDGLGLWAQHGWWEPLHDALDTDSENAA